MALTSTATHLSEVGSAAELKLKHQGAVCHFVYILTFCRKRQKRMLEAENTGDGVLACMKEGLNFLYRRQGMNMSGCGRDKGQRHRKRDIVT